MDSLFSFPVGLFHPLQHAGLSRRTPDRRRYSRSARLPIPSGARSKGLGRHHSLRRGHRPQEGPDYRFKAIRLVIRKPVASILDLFDL